MEIDNYVKIFTTPYSKFCETHYQLFIQENKNKTKIGNDFIVTLLAL